MAYIEQLNRVNLHGETWSSIRCNFSESIDLTGNEWIEIVLTDTVGVKAAGIFHHPATRCLYMATEEGEEPLVGISKLWYDEEYLTKNPPRILPIFPSFHEYEDGTLRSVMHVKNGDFVHYGRPQSFSSLVDQYTEYQNRIYLAKVSRKNFLPQVLLEMEESDKGNSFINNKADQQAGFKNTADRMNQNFTNDGSDPSTLMVTSRPYGAKPMLVHEFSPNTREVYFEKVGKVLRENIIMSHDWSEMILRSEGASGFSTQILKDIFEIKSATVILERQNLVDATLNTIVNFIISDWFEVSGFEDIAQRSKSPIQSLLETIVSDPDTISTPTPTDEIV